MKFEKLSLEGAYYIKEESKRDIRGSFTRMFCHKEFEKKGINFLPVQVSFAYTELENTIRGMHYQDPHPEGKLICCTEGQIYDVIVDMRKDSPMYLKWEGIRLYSSTQMLYIPKGFAHGYQTLSRSTTVLYMIDEYYHPEYSKGFRFNDPSINIDWIKTNLDVPFTLSVNDMGFPLLKEV